MKQVVQHLKTGETLVEEVPVPSIADGRLLIRTEVSVISTGTERMLLEFSRASYLEKMRQQPERARQVLEKIRTDGVASTLQSVFGKLNTPLPMGYSNVGRIVEVGKGVCGFSPGNRVVSNGSHAEYVSVPPNLCARIPDGVESEQAAFAIIGAIALQGIRLVDPTLGERVAVIGLGLIGLITAQLLRANGCSVLGIDIDPQKVDLAKAMDIEAIAASDGGESVAAAREFSAGSGMDAVIIATATDSRDPIRNAAAMCRTRGRIVLVGVSGLTLRREDFYEKELSFQVSCSYGPGRYDPNYEEKGQDYPIGFVRWTEKRNIEAILQLMSSGALDTSPLVSGSYSIDEAPAAYRSLLSDTSNLGIILRFGDSRDDLPAKARTIELEPTRKLEIVARPGFSAIGAGNYAGGILLPAFKAAGAKFRILASQSGLSAAIKGRALGFAAVTTDLESVFSDEETNAVVIATPHNTHARLTIRALQQGKHVFVEKPLALSRHELDEIESVYKSAGQESQPPIVMSGFNRRFSPLVSRLKTEIGNRASPPAIIYTVNAGRVPAGHWLLDPEVGGGRIIGEACHFVDLARYLADSKISAINAARLGEGPDPKAGPESAAITITFENGTLATIIYLANGNKSFVKERLEVFQAGRIFQLDNFRRLRAYGGAPFSISHWRQEKGQRQCATAFVDAIKSGGPAPIPFEELIEVGRACVEAWDQICS